MKRFDVLLEESISDYSGEFSNIIHQSPAFYRLMVRLLDDRDLPKQVSQLVIAAIAYFILPADVIPEDKYGALGYIDDIFLCALVADRVMKETGSEDILIRNWDGEGPIVPLIRDILEREKELIGDKKDQITEFIEED